MRLKLLSTLSIVLVIMAVTTTFAPLIDSSCDWVPLWSGVHRLLIAAATVAVLLRALHTRQVDLWLKAHLAAAVTESRPPAITEHRPGQRGTQ